MPVCNHTAHLTPHCQQNNVYPDCASSFFISIKAEAKIKTGFDGVPSQ